jgi:phage-related protein
MDENLIREIVTYGDYFEKFYGKLDKRTQIKVDWTLNLIETIELVPKKYFKHLTGTDGLYEIRIEYNSNIYRVFSFFDDNKLVIAINGFQKKSQKTPIKEIDKALKIKKQYFDGK